ncbi:MAG TPA: ureidoglycolate lyase [Sandaracinaceae bacterium]
MRTLRAEPIDAGEYAAFGALIAPRPSAPRSANHGRAQAWDDLASLVNERPERARPSVSLFRCMPERSGVLEVRWLERHPRSTQMFVPMRAGRYLVVVAHGSDAPALDSLRAFVVEGSRAITYRPGIWHHPMVALDDELDFVNFLFVDGSDEDCHEVAFDPPCARVLLR